MTKINQAIGIFGFGIFIYLCISSLSSLMEEITHDILILLHTKPFINFLITELTSFIIFILPILVLIKRISKDYNLLLSKIGKYLVWSFIAFLILQGLSILYLIVEPFIINDQFSDLESEYFIFIRDNYGLYYVKSAFYFVAMLIWFLLIYKEYKNSSQQRV